MGLKPLDEIEQMMRARYARFHGVEARTIRLRPGAAS
jgi:hypothetical protein